MHTPWCADGDGKTSRDISHDDHGAWASSRMPSSLLSPSPLATARGSTQAPAIPISSTSGSMWAGTPNQAILNQAVTTDALLMSHRAHPPAQRLSSAARKQPLPSKFVVLAFKIIVGFDPDSVLGLVFQRARQDPGMPGMAPGPGLGAALADSPQRDCGLRHNGPIRSPPEGL